jgi:FkbM family methyltransferase
MFRPNLCGFQNGATPTNYLQGEFVEFLGNPLSFEYIIEAGARDGLDAINLSRFFPNASIFAFECNPDTVDLCIQNLAGHSRVSLTPNGLGEKNEDLPFYSYTENNPGASSFLKRIDYESTQQLKGHARIIRLEEFLEDHRVPRIDLLCMDVQGFELNVLRGCGRYLQQVRFIIMEEPTLTINEQYLPRGVHSKYTNAPTSAEISDFMTKHGFVEVARKAENQIEDNVLYQSVANMTRGGR